jgi:hypothetical protein
LVDELTRLVDDKVWVERAFVASVIRTLRSAAHSWKCDAAEAWMYSDVLYIAAISALNVKACGLWGECAGANDDAGYADEVGNVCCSQTTNGGLGDRGV